MSTSNTLTKNDLKKVLEKLSVGSGGDGALIDMEWKLVGTVTGNSILTLPNTYNELLCYTLDNASGLSGGFTFHFNADILTTTPIVYRNGYNFNGASLTNLQMTNTTAQITYYVRDGVDMLSQCSLKVYYR